MHRLGLKAIVVNHISIKIFDSDKILGDNVLLSQIVELNNQELTIDLIMFEMLNFDKILDMDFLSKYRAKIDCIKKKVKFILDNGDNFSFSGLLLNLMIRSVKAYKMLNK